MVSAVIGAVTAKKIADKIAEDKKDKESRNPDPKTVEETDKENKKKKIKEKESGGDLKINKELIDQIKEKFKDKDVKLQAAFKKKLAKGGRVMYGSGSKVKGCKLAKRGKGKAYGKNS
mgnify:CR=1 FL=1